MSKGPCRPGLFFCQRGFRWGQAHSGLAALDLGGTAMPNFRFMHAHFPNSKLSKHEITLRLSGHRCKLLAARMGVQLPRQDAAGVEGGLDGWQDREPQNLGVLAKADIAKIERRAALINARVNP